MTVDASAGLASASEGALATAVMSAGPAGSPAEEAELCRRFGRRVRLYGRLWLRDEGAVDDLVQRVLLLLVTKLRGGAVREPERIDSFVLGTARMVTRELSRAREQPTELDEELPCPLSETRPERGRVHLVRAVGRHLGPSGRWFPSSLGGRSGFQHVAGHLLPCVASLLVEGHRPRLVLRHPC